MERRRFLGLAGASAVPLGGCTTSGSPTAITSTPSSGTRTAPASRTETTSNASGVPDPNDALVVESRFAIGGTNVNVGAGGVAKNATGRWLVDCVIEVTGVLDGRTFGARATRSPLSPHGTWEWKVPFGGAADALADDGPERISVRTRADYRDWDR